MFNFTIFLSLMVLQLFINFLKTLYFMIFMNYFLYQINKYFHYLHKYFLNLSIYQIPMKF